VVSLNLNQVKKWHFVGVGGAGMSAIARVLLELGYEVSGSDLKESRFTHCLKELGAQVQIGHHPGNLAQAEAVVYSSAIPQGNVEIVEAKTRGLPLLSRAQMLALLTRDKRTVAVSGTHGKTTTTSMVATVLEKGGLEPSYIIGGDLNEIGTNAKAGEGSYFVVEADESDGSFLQLNPFIGVVTNVEAEHLDYYGTYENVKEGFKNFVEKVSEEGFIVACADQPETVELVSSDKRVITYGLNEKADWQGLSVQLEKFSSSFQVAQNGQKLSKDFHLAVPGLHNVQNALAAIAVGVELGISVDEIAEALASFKGVARRFQLKGKLGEVTLVDDYAHHPSEVVATLESARNGDWSRIVCVFQPHRYTRTKFLGRDFGHCFQQADWLVLTEVYSAGEEPIPGVSGKLVLDAVLETCPHSRVAFLPTLNEVKDFLLTIVREGDLVLTLGAGDVTLLGDELLRSMKENEFGAGRKALSVS
jgi:UDP-N-acetylmuramate--alanine ligase